MLLFGPLAEAAGASSVALPAVPGLTAEGVVAQVAERLPSLRGWLDPSVCAVAVNQRYATPDTPVSPDDEVALIPPVSGG